MTNLKRVKFACAGLLAMAVAGEAGGGVVEFEFDADAFHDSTTLSNDYWGLRLGGPLSAVYFSEADEGCEISQSVVAGSTAPGFFAAPYGIVAVVVRDREWVDEQCTGDYVLVEDTFDWFAQDDQGNVWYLGEDTTAWDEEGDCLTSAGSWKAGEDDAVPGVVMLADPRPGVWYQQEYLAGEAEDRAKVLRLDADVGIELGDYAACLATKEYTPLAPGEVEHKYYCPLSEGGAGLTLVEELNGKTRRVEYVGTTPPVGDLPDEFPVPLDQRCSE